MSADPDAGPAWDEELALRLVLPALTAATSEAAAITSVAARVASIIAGGGRVFTFGAGHAQAFAAEFHSRAGGLWAYTSMSLEDLRETPREAHLQYSDSMPERDPANGVALLERYGVAAADALLVASQSGRNGASVEMARRARARGTYTVGVTSVAHSLAFPSRHPEGLRLLDVVDVVIDNHCPVGDAAIELPTGGQVAAVSTVSFALIAQLLNARVLARLAAVGHAADVIRSANIDPDSPHGAAWT